MAKANLCVVSKSPPVNVLWGYSFLNQREGVPPLLSPLVVGFSYALIFTPVRLCLASPPLTHCESQEKCEKPSPVNLNLPQPDQGTSAGDLRSGPVSPRPPQKGKLLISMLLSSQVKDTGEETMSAQPALQARYQRYKSLQQRYAKSFDALSNLRLGVFLLGLAGFLAAYYLGYPVYAGSILLFFLLIFVLLVLKHGRVERQLNMARAMSEVNRRYLDRIDGSWVKFSDTGEEFRDAQHAYSSDLDIFGPNSLFQWISSASTYYGRECLRKLLADPSRDGNSIKKRQDAIGELTRKLDFCQQLESRGLLAEEVGQDPRRLTAYAEEPGQIKGLKVARLLPLFTMGSFTLYLTGGLFLFLPLFFLLIQSFFILYFHQKLDASLTSVYLFKKSLGCFQKMLELIESEPFDNPDLEALQAQLSDRSESASAAMQKLDRISDAINVRYQPLFHFPLNLLFLWDVQCALSLEKWKNRYGKNVRRWFYIMGTFEAWSSLAIISHIHPTWVFPEVEDRGQTIVARGLGHPLLPPDRCVRNDMTMENTSCIVTGSNMSGKSTWLRAIGTNLVLAYAGSAVCARELKCSIMDLYTSMVIRDDLISGISTFYAELARISMILEHSRRDRPMLYLIDEIFRGTNSLDRIAGARTVLKNLSENGAMGLISTHDFELCELEQEKWCDFKNHHFEEHYENGCIKFDYRLRSGRCTTSNARYLMKMVGIQVPKQQEDHPRPLKKQPNAGDQ